MYTEQSKRKKEQLAENSENGFCNINTETGRSNPLVIWQKKRSLAHIHEKGPPYHTTNIGEKKSEVWRRKISFKGIIRNQWARSRHQTLIKRRKKKTAD